jgi:hypothetical protein
MEEAAAQTFHETNLSDEFHTENGGLDLATTKPQVKSSGVHVVGNSCNITYFQLLRELSHC